MKVAWRKKNLEGITKKILLKLASNLVFQPFKFDNVQGE